MIRINIPGHESLAIEYVVFDYNGTLAVDGILIDGIAKRLMLLSKTGVKIFVLTANTFGTVEVQCDSLPLEITVFSKDNISEEKKRFVEELGPASTIAIGNGRNDLAMFQKSILSIAVIGKEGCCTQSVMVADIVVNGPIDAIDLLLNNNRIVATLRT